MIRNHQADRKDWKAGDSLATTERLRRPILLGLILAMIPLAGGCVERQMTIRSNPPGALVYIDDYEIGVTPISTSFIYYGNRKIRLVKDGYETLTVIQPVPTPWYQIPPLDFVSENLVPGKLRDQRTLDFAMKRQAVVPTEQLMARAEGLRRGMQPAMAGDAVPASPGVRVNPVPGGPAVAPSPTGPPMAPGVGGQPTYPLPPAGPALGR